MEGFASNDARRYALTVGVRSEDEKRYTIRCRCGASSGAMAFSDVQDWQTVHDEATAVASGACR